MENSQMDSRLAVHMEGAWFRFHLPAQLSPETSNEAEAATEHPGLQ